MNFQKRPHSGPLLEIFFLVLMAAVGTYEFTNLRASAETHSCPLYIYIYIYIYI